MSIGKLGSRGSLTLETCNGARKTRHIIDEKFHEAAEALRKDESENFHVLEAGCWNHLRNVWLGGMKNAFYTLLGNTLMEELYEID